VFQHSTHPLQLKEKSMNGSITTIARRAIGLIVLVVALLIPGTAMARDRDHDHMRDSWEKKHGLSTHRANGHRDPDHDGLSNHGEFRAHTDPHDADTDDDCIGDAEEDADDDGVDNEQEMRNHTALRNPDSDGDGVEDGDEDADHDGIANRDDDQDDEQGDDDDQGDDDQGECENEQGDDEGEQESGDDESDS